MEEEGYFNVDMIPGLCSNLTIQQLIIRKMVYRKAFIEDKEENDKDNSIVSCNPQMLVTLLEIFNKCKCRVLENAYGDWWDNYWWIFLIIGGLGVFGMIIWRIWDCCDPKLERTNSVLKKENYIT
jgi:hypothetical protein